ncbi:MAG: ABC transporter permease [Clostridia bacterium]|nr:ABC transporter permease [Clostridia bacterium]
MKKININGLMISISFFLASFFIVVFVNQLSMNKENNRNYDMFNGPDSRKISITCAEPFLLSPWDYGEDFVIYNMVREVNTHYDSDWVRVVYGKGDFPTPSMKNGQFFTEEQMLSSEPLCVIGTNVSKRSGEIIDGEEYYTYEGVRYRVIGHMGTNVATDLDVMVMLNWGGYFENKTVCSGNYIIDSDNKSVIESAVEKVKSDVESSSGTEFKPLVFRSTIRSFDSSSRTIYPIALIILILSIVVISIFYIKSISYQIAVKKLVGFSMPMLFLELALKFVKYALSGLALALVSMFLLTFNETYASSEIGYFTVITPWTVVYAAVVTVVLAVVLSVVPVIAIYKIDTSEKIK